jgi:hypothetical protein
MHFNRTRVDRTTFRKLPFAAKFWFYETWGREDGYFYDYIPLIKQGRWGFLMWVWFGVTITIAMSDMALGTDANVVRVPKCLDGNFDGFDFFI